MKAYIGLGSNLGDREANLRSALEHLARTPETTVVRASSLYDTEPVGVEEQPHFLNAVAQLETQLTPHQLLWNLMLIERRVGRVRSQPGSRVQFWSGSRSGGRACASRSRTSDGPRAGVPSSK